MKTPHEIARETAEKIMYNRYGFIHIDMATVDSLTESILAALTAATADLRADKAELIRAAELLLIGYEGLGGDMENNGPRLMRQAIDAARTAERGEGQK